MEKYEKKLLVKPGNWQVETVFPPSEKVFSKGKIEVGSEAE